MSDLSLSDRNARLLALIVPLALLGGAYLSEYGFGLYPCEMCWWQRYPHFAAVVLALLAFVAQPKRVWTALAALAIAVSGAIGLFHAGVEYGWWEGITGCSTTVSGTANALEAVLNAPIIRCDVAQWELFGISLAGWNGLFSLGSAAAIFGLLLAKERI
ncbi:MAG: disulfide bond formation protein B [Sphingomonadales bacterium 32-64-17]|nr:MAG: disulfide bond formation protein B [Sphingomonadales bacterium 32-64-17]